MPNLGFALIAPKVKAGERLKSAAIGGLVGAGLAAVVTASVFAVAIAIAPSRVSDFLVESIPLETLMAITIPLGGILTAIVSGIENLAARTFKDQTERINAYSALDATNDIINERLVSLGFATEKELNNYDAIRSAGR